MSSCDGSQRSRRDSVTQDGGFEPVVGVTLVEIRDRVEALASDDGTYYVVCGRTGDRPVPAAGKRFDSRSDARAALRATEQYRTTLRRYDPQVPYYDLIVCEAPAREPTAARSGGSAGDLPQERLSEPVLADTTTPERRALVEFCHRVAGAVFETLSESGDDAVETAVMDAYFEFAETVDDPDDLCLCLLESMASELDGRLTAAGQADLLADAAARLEPSTRGSDPLDATLSVLEARGLVDRYSRSPWSVAPDGGVRSVVGIDGYALEPHDGRLPVLPITVELCRHRPQRLPTSVETAAVDDGWRVTFDLGETTARDGLVSAPIGGDVES